MSRSARLAALFCALAVWALLALAPLTAAAQEVIRSFDTVIEVRPDASIEITETIAVTAERRAILRGIFRDVPTVLEAERGGVQRSDLEVISVRRNGAEEPYAIESIRDGVRIRIGTASVLIDPGPHTYEIRYTMTRAARMFSDFDELYWNATGNFWQFPILAAETIVRLPEGGVITGLAVYTGGQGARETSASAERVSDREARFVLDAPLGPQEGMTVSVAFEKGLLVPPPPLDAVGYWLSDHRAYLVSILGIVIALVYNGWAWTTVGRDPAKGVIFPRFHPPEGYSPALVHYVHRLGWRNSGWEAFSAALVSLARKGLITIAEEGGKTTLASTFAQPSEPLPSGEKVIERYIRTRSSVTIDTKTGPDLNKQRAAFIRAIENENSKVYFKNNTTYVVFGVALAAILLGALVVVEAVAFELLFVSLIAAAFVGLAVFALRSYWPGGPLNLAWPLIVVAMVGVNLFGLLLDRFTAIDFPLIAAATIAAITAIFGVLMRAPTIQGRKRMDEIDGFKMYLETAERERLNFQGEPDMTTTRFEAILPYAMALGVERPWAERFQADLARHAVADAPAGYRPAWYAGRSFTPSTIGSRMAAIGTGLSAAMVAAQPASASGSGVGGGGFAGGGGGGGGGGGW